MRKETSAGRVPPFFTFAMQLGFPILQKKDGDITVIYNQDDNVRYIRVNDGHPATLVPSPMGDSVGHWQGNSIFQKQWQPP